MLLLLFVAAMVCRSSVCFMCHCGEHKVEKEHICCGCPKHALDCHNHDFVFKSGFCNLHYALNHYLIESFDIEPNSFRSSSIEAQTPILIYCNDQSKIDMAKLCCKQFWVDCYSFVSTPWSGVSSSLRAPPVLV